MARLRLFAGLRDAAGTGSVDVDGATVGEVLDAASEKFGTDFTMSAERARVWVNGDEAERDVEVGPDDEIALIPPVSGGSGRDVGGLAAFAWIPAAVAGLALILANTADGSVIWSTIVVGVVSAWVADVSATASVRGRDIPLIPTLLSIVSMVVSTQMLGVEGLALGAALSVVLPLTWSVASDESRVLNSLAP